MHHFYYISIGKIDWVKQASFERRSRVANGCQMRTNGKCLIIQARWVKAIDLGCSGQTQAASQAKRLGKSKLVGRGKDVNNSAARRDIIRQRGISLISYCLGKGPFINLTLLWCFDWTKQNKDYQKLQ